MVAFQSMLNGLLRAVNAVVEITHPNDNIEGRLFLGGKMLVREIIRQRRQFGVPMLRNSDFD